MGLGQAWRGAPPAIRYWMLPAIITTFSLLFEFAADAGRLALRFDRVGITGGQFWRLLTGHFVHLGWGHLVLNVLGLILVWSICGRAFSVRGWCLVLLLVLVGIDAGLWFLDPGLEWYVGLSGLLHGMLIAGILALLLKGSRDLLLLALLVAGKVVWEQLIGPLPGSEGLAGAAVVVNAHLYGALAGIAAALLIRVGPNAPI
jgi:rhomboid family GlyGly-CTERM serine protease